MNKMNSFSGPMFDPSEDEHRKSVHGKTGGHYNNFGAKYGMEMELLRSVFPDGEADEYNFVLFSTSGVHGSYMTIEEAWDQREEREAEASEYDEEYVPSVTFLLVQPRLCTLTHGNIEINSEDDAKFLKKLRQSSWDVAANIGAPE